jgi:sn-glycerol 3-phosphate transport system substrate-binding protein
LTIAWQGWTQLESFSAWHNVEFATKNNGLRGIERPAEGQLAAACAPHRKPGQHGQAGPVRLQGPHEQLCPRRAFISGECAMIDHVVTGFYGNVAKKNAKFAYGLSAQLPYYPDVARRAAEHRHRRRQPVGHGGQEGRRIQGHRSLLQLPVIEAGDPGGHPPAHGLPADHDSAAFELTEKSGLLQRKPRHRRRVRTQMIRKTTDKSRGIRLGNYVQIRTIEDEELEQIWAGKKSAKEALDAIVKRGNEMLERFQKANKK